MPIPQIGDWPTIVETAVCLMLIVAIVIEHRRVSLLKREVQQLSRDVLGVVSAEQRRFMQELNPTTKKPPNRSPSRDPLGCQRRLFPRRNRRPAQRGPTQLTLNFRCSATVGTVPMIFLHGEICAN